MSPDIAAGSNGAERFDQQSGKGFVLGMNEFDRDRHQMATMRAIDIAMVQVAPLAHSAGDCFNLIVGKE